MSRIQILKCPFVPCTGCAPSAGYLMLLHQPKPIFEPTLFLSSRLLSVVVTKSLKVCQREWEDYAPSASQPKGASSRVDTTE